MKSAPVRFEWPAVQIRMGKHTLFWRRVHSKGMRRHGHASSVFGDEESGFAVHLSGTRRLAPMRGTRILRYVKETAGTRLARELDEFVGHAESGETFPIRKPRRRAAGLVPECEFRSGKRAAELFRSHNATAQDKAAADAIEAEIRKLDQEQDDALAG